MEAYATLVSKVDAFFAAATRRGADLACGAGCTACCQVELTVSPVEAEVVAQALARRGSWEPAEEGCALLEAGGRCAIYAARPLVCRSQGLPLAYPPGTIGADAICGRAGATELTWCPLNFRKTPPAGADVFDAGRADEALAFVNRVFCAERDRDPLDRIPLRLLAERAIRSID